MAPGNGAAPRGLVGNLVYSAEDAEPEAWPLELEPSCADVYDLYAGDWANFGGLAEGRDF